MRRHSNVKGILFAALGIGLLISLILPDKFIIIVLAFALVLCGFMLCKQ